jgi:hypothetical protein
VGVLTLVHPLAKKANFSRCDYKINMGGSHEVKNNSDD